MTINEILACEIPEGKYELALKLLRAYIWGTIDKCCIKYPRDETIKSCHASFEALYELAKGKYCSNCITESIDSEKDKQRFAKKIASEAWDESAKQSRSKAIDDVQGVMKDHIKKCINKCKPDLPAEIVARVFLESAKASIEAIEALKKGKG